MQHSSPFLLLLLLLAASPLLTAAETFYCFGGVHETNSTYGANLRRLAAVLPAETASSQGLRASGDVGYWPNRPNIIRISWSLLGLLGVCDYSCKKLEAQKLSAVHENVCRRIHY
ncbi:hypothetical protein TRIUR3_10308 [Triticum urartu]|uniref:Uncharacterized protein n=1 Tax=Triticum urartu TaxID=4572 RepID=M7Z867_TRIUA|nr:hypothetical protein TRIUR3_10308 [Triticum urartu]